jgi:hypothetical protein
MKVVDKKTKQQIINTNTLLLYSIFLGLMFAANLAVDVLGLSVLFKLVSSAFWCGGVVYINISNKKSQRN